MKTPLKSIAKAALARLLPILLILIIGGIGVQTITSCSGDDGGGADPSSSSRGGGNSSPFGGIILPCDTLTYAMLTPCEDGTVTIGDQVWQKCNSYAVPSAGDFRCYCNKPESCEIYGRLYDWTTAMALPSDCNSESCADQINKPYHQGICLPNWHIPTKEEWEALTAYIESSKGCTKCDAKHLKSTIGWAEDGNGTDAFGFSALPGGSFIGATAFSFVNAGKVGHFWSANEHNQSNRYYAHYQDLSYENEYANWSMHYKTFGRSVRCLKD